MTDALPRVYFMAIPRTGGTSLHNTFAEIYEDQCQPQLSFKEMDQHYPEIREKYRFFAGHYGKNFDFNEDFTFTIFREPITRLKSVHRRYVALGNKIGLREFIHDVYIPNGMMNYQAKFPIREDPLLLDKLSDGELFELALRAYEDVAIGLFGELETFYRRVVAYTLKMPEIPKLRWMNAVPPVDEPLDLDTFMLLNQCTRVSHRLYMHFSKMSLNQRIMRGFR